MREVDQNQNGIIETEEFLQVNEPFDTSMFIMMFCSTLFSVDERIEYWSCIDESFC